MQVQKRKLFMQDEQGLWDAYCAGYFHHTGKETDFWFVHQQSLCRATWGEPKLYKYPIKGAKIPLPSTWFSVTVQDRAYLYSRYGFTLDMGARTLLTDIPNRLTEEISHQISRRPDLEKDDFCVGDYRICHYGQWGYRCFKGDALQWTFRGRGYLYTDIVRYEDCICFGTGGQGGYFYVIDLYTGEAKIVLRTGGIKSFILEDHRCYVLSKHPKSRLVELNMDTYEIVREYPLEGTVNMESALAKFSKEINCTTFQYSKEGMLKNCIWTKLLCDD